MYRTLRFWLGLAFSILCLWLAVRSTPLAELGSAMTGGNYLWLLPGMVLQLLAVVARSQRWVELLEKRVGLTDAFWAGGVGFLFTNLLPLRLGEAARVLVLSSKSRVPVVQVGTSAVVERLLDVATVVLVLVVVLPWMRVPPLVASAGLFLGAMVVIALAVMILIARFTEHARSLVLSVCRYVPVMRSETIVARWDELVAGLSPLAQPAIAGRVAAWSAVTWASSIGVYLCVIKVFQPAGNLLEAAFMLVALALAITVPSSPGFIGVFQLVGQQALMLPFGDKYSASEALAITLAAHMTYYVVTTLLGVAGMWYFGESFGRIVRSTTSSRRDGSAALGKPPVA